MTGYIMAVNGVIHEIDAVLAPLEENVEWAGTFDVTNPATGEAFETLTWSAQSNEEGGPRPSQLVRHTTHPYGTPPSGTPSQPS